MGKDMKITFIQVKITWCKKNHFSWNRFEPTIYAKLKSLVPDDIECELIDTRFENVNYDLPTDVVVMSVTTINAKLAYEIADEYRKRGVKVILGGIHVNLIPEEAKLHADSIAIGESELIFTKMMEDLKNGSLQPEYKSVGRYDFKDYKMDLSIFKGKKYFPIHCIETSRGCIFKCNFCSLAPMYNQQVIYRNPDDVIDEIKNYKAPFILFVDENFGNNIEHTSEILRKLIPLKKRWVAQMSVNSLQKPEFVELMQKSGCFNIFIGFETTNPQSLKAMNKSSNLNQKNYETALSNCVKYDITITGGFINGYLEDTVDTVKETCNYANSFQFLNCMMSNLNPFPGTPIYDELKEKGWLLNEKWWLSEEFYYNRKPIYYTDKIKADEMPKQGFSAMLEFFEYKNIFKRFINSRYRLKMRLFILLVNIYFKYTFKVLGG